MEYVIRFQWDSESNVWIASNDDIPITLEDESLDALMARVRVAVPELLEMNNMPMPKYLFFLAQNREEVTA